MARRAEILKAKDKDGEFPAGMCGIMKKWRNSHRLGLLQALTGLTQRPESGGASQLSAPPEEEIDEIAPIPDDEELTLGQVWSCDGVYPDYLERAGLDRDDPMTLYPHGT